MAKKTSGKKSAAQSRYFRAAGQILMVFLGVTLALLFDEWRHGQKTQQIEAFYLEQLELELQQAIAGQTNDSLGFSALAYARQRIGDAVLRGQSVPDATLRQLLPRCCRELPVPANLPAFEALQATGQLGILQNKTLLKSLLQLHLTTLPALRSRVEHCNRFENEQMPSGAENVAASLQDARLHRILQNPVFESLAEQYKQLLILQKELLRQIQEERVLNG
ncbi:MAG: hypothetical protein IT260_07585 [Saprospiraceae bacterium]|nr:hypothetical protein [Saprospiraceae bacterium]